MRYLILVFLNLPVVVIALVNIVTQYKLKRISKGRFRHQIILWLLILAVVVGSFPLYNYLVGRPTLDSIDLSAFDIAQTTAIVWLFYIINSQRQRIDQAEQRIKDLHRELSIRLSGKDS